MPNWAPNLEKKVNVFTILLRFALLQTQVVFFSPHKPFRLCGHVALCLDRGWLRCPRDIWAFQTLIVYRHGVCGWWSSVWAAIYLIPASKYHKVGVGCSHGNNTPPLYLNSQPKAKTFFLSHIVRIPSISIFQLCHILTYCFHIADAFI